MIIPQTRGYYRLMTIKEKKSLSKAEKSEDLSDGQAQDHYDSHTSCNKGVKWAEECSDLREVRKMLQTASMIMLITEGGVLKGVLRKQ
jgi:hypothetical protein